MASRKEEKEQRRQERLARERAEREQNKRRRLYATVAGAVLVVATIGAIVVVVAAGGDGGSSGEGAGFGIDGQPPPTQRITALDQAAKAADCRLSNPPIEGRTHVQEKVKYKTNPPTSGNHNPVPADDGAYSKAPPIERLVHSLEHGRIIVWYQQSLPRNRLARLKGLFDEDPYHMLLAASESSPYEVAASAWGHFVGCKKFSNESFDVLRTFRDRYRDKGPEFVP